MMRHFAGGLVLVSTFAGCAVAPAIPRGRGADAVIVTRADMPLGPADGAAGRRGADAQCGGRGVVVSIYDRFDAGRSAWVYPGGCA